MLYWEETENDFEHPVPTVCIFHNNSMVPPNLCANIITAPICASVSECGAANSTLHLAKIHLFKCVFSMALLSLTLPSVRACVFLLYSIFTFHLTSFKSTTHKCSSAIWLLYNNPIFTKKMGICRGGQWRMGKQLETHAGCAILGVKAHKSSSQQGWGTLL